MRRPRRREDLEEEDVEEKKSDRKGTEMASKGIQPHNIAVAPSSRAYLERVEKLGLLEGEPGRQEIKSSAQPVLEVLHHVLGGGTVSITVETPGNVTVVEDLNTLLKKPMEETRKQPPGDYQMNF